MGSTGMSVEKAGGSGSAPKISAPPANTTQNAVGGASGDAKQAVAQQPTQSLTGFNSAALLHSIEDIVSQLAALLRAMSSKSGGAIAGATGSGSSPAQTPIQSPKQEVSAPIAAAIAGASGGASPEQSPKQSPVQSPEQMQVVQVPPVKAGGPIVPDLPTEQPIAPITEVVISTPPVADIKLDNTDKNKQVLLKTANGDYVKLSGDPHIEVSIGGKIQKFDIGFGPGGFALPDGTKVTWDTNSKHILDNFQINGVKVSTFDNVDVHNASTGSAETNLSAIASQFQQLQGNWNQPLGSTTAKPAPKPAAKAATAAKAAPKPAPAAKAQVVVKKGDTLTAIAKANKTTVAALVTANGIKNPNLIVPGQKIALPKKK